jgi:hypothetical protein
MIADSPANPREERLVVKMSDLEAVVLPRLLGTVFHVTTALALEGIKTSGFIRSNQDGQLAYTFPQSQNNYGRQLGYVCLFDLRDVPEERLRESLSKFHFLQPTKADPVFLFLDTSEYGKLVPWTVAPAGAMAIPFVETWFPGDLPVTALTDALSVTVDGDDADSAYRGIMRGLQRDRERLIDTGLVRIEARTAVELSTRAMEWARIAQDAGLHVDQGWEEGRVEKSDAGFRISLHAERIQVEIRPEPCPSCGNELRSHVLEWQSISIRGQPFFPATLDCMRCGYSRPILEPGDGAPAPLLDELTPAEWDKAYGQMMATWRRGFVSEERFLAAYHELYGDDDSLMKAWRLRG